MNRLLPALCCATLWAAVPARPLVAQQVQGRVVFQTTTEPAVPASVVLLDSALDVVASADVDSAGRFAFAPPRPGRYSLQATHQGTQSAVVQANPGEETMLEVFPPILRAAMSCDAATTALGATLVGTIRDAASGVPLPGARVSLRLADGASHTQADGLGIFRFCGVATDGVANLAATLLDRSADADLELPDAGIAHVDLLIDMDAVEFHWETTARRTLPPGTPSSLVFQLRDAATDRPLGGASVRVEGGAGPVETSNLGTAIINGLAAGRTTAIVEMIGYGRREVVVDVATAEQARVEVALPALPIALDPIAVRSRAHIGSEIRDLASPASASIVSGRDMALAQERASSVADVLRARVQGVNVREGQYSTIDSPLPEPIVCLEATRRLERLTLPPGVEAPFCDMAVVIVDGVRIFSPGGYLRGLSVRDIESLEFLNPTDAGIRYGPDASNTGALLLWTRGRGPYRSAERGRH